MVRAFVTGGSGFVGANLVSGLNDRGIDTTVLMRASSSTKALEGLHYERLNGDILDPAESLAEAMSGHDWVFHVAAVSDYWRQDTRWLYRVNVQGTRNVLDAAKLAGVKRFVYTSSLAAMGAMTNGKFLDESCTFNLEPRRFPYGHSKHLAEIEVQKAVEDGLPAVIVNQSISLGARDVNVISGALVVEAARGLARVVLPGGTNYIAIEDVIFGHIAAAEHGRVGERYILGGTNITHAQAIEVVCDVVGRPAPKIKLRKWMLPPAAGVIGVARRVLGNLIPFDENQVRLLAEELYANNEKAITELGLHVTPFRIAVQNTFDWYNENGYLSQSP